MHTASCCRPDGERPASDTDCIWYYSYFPYFTDVYALNGRPVRQITVLLRSGDFDAYLEIYDTNTNDPTATPLAFNNNGGGNFDAMLVFTPPSTGTYYIHASSTLEFQAGYYVLTLSGDPAVTDGWSSTITQVSITTSSPGCRTRSPSSMPARRSGAGPVRGIHSRLIRPRKLAPRRCAATTFRRDWATRTSSVVARSNVTRPGRRTRPSYWKIPPSCRRSCLRRGSVRPTRRRCIGSSAIVLDANHRYMTDRTVRDQMVAKGWLAEGDGPDLVVMCAPQ